MTTEQAKTLSENALNQLMAALESGQSEALKLFLAVMSRFRYYSWGNCLMIYTQRPNATYCCRIPSLASPGALRAQGREGHRDSRPDGRQEEICQRSN